jgi:lipid-binding SYLF domain-containing protein
MKNLIRIAISVVAVFLLGMSTSFAKSGAEIDAEVNEAIAAFQKEVNGSEVFLRHAAGLLVFPRVVKGGFVVGYERGDGALRVGGKTVDYYRTQGPSFGAQLGLQAKTVVIAFMTNESLQKFRDSSGWKVGVDGSVALIDMGAGKTIDTANIKDPVVGFVFGSKGLMYNLTLEGTKFSKLDKSK